MLLTWSRKFYLRAAKNTSYVFLVSFKDGRRRVSSRFHLFVLDGNQQDEVG